MKKPAGEGRGEWAAVDMKMSERTAAHRHKIPRSALQREVKAISINQSTDVTTKWGL